MMAIGRQSPGWQSSCASCLHSKKFSVARVYLGSVLLRAALTGMMHNAWLLS